MRTNHSSQWKQLRKPFIKSAKISRAVLLLFCLLLFSGCGTGTLIDELNPPPTPPPADQETATPTPVPLGSVALREIHMFDQKNGWALTEDKHILHTTNGPQQWQNVTPSQFGTPDTLEAANFLDARYAWIGMKIHGSFSVLYTVDGGNIWLQTFLLGPGKAIQQIHFVNSTYGWLLFQRDAANADGKTVELLSSSNGGQTWLTIASSTPATNNSQQKRLPLNAAETAITFKDARTGWLTGQSTDTQHFPLQMTRDGGQTWQQQDLKVSSANGEDSITTQSPIFQNDTNGFLPVLLSTTNGTDATLIVYTTRNGGQNWSATTPVSGISSAFTSGMESIFFSDAQHGWAVGNATNIYATSDGGKSWSVVSSKLVDNIKTVLQLNFISDTQGWALCSATNGRSILLQTGDGGQSWSQVVQDSQDEPVPNV